MNLSVDIAIIAGSVCILFVPFVSSNDRARWAKILFVAAGLVGILSHALSFALDTHWLTLSHSANHDFSRVFELTDGLLVGWFTALVLSGQIDGKKPVQTEKA